MTMTERTYSAKVLLFGEYSILLGGDGLGRPLRTFSAQWSNREDKVAVLKHLIEPLSDLELEASIDQDRLEKELSGTLSFASDIPIGKGLGSSGALTAALYDRFAIHNQLDRAAKFSDLGRIEGALFHERSSGFDALVSLEDVDFHLVGGRASTVEIPVQNEPLIYLLDSERTRSTGPLVRRFLELVRAPSFAREMKGMAKVNDGLIANYCSGVDYWDLLDQISRMQLELMHFCIPGDIAALWESVLASDECRIKLCGAGGGGFYLLFSKKRMEERMNTFPIALCSF